MFFLNDLKNDSYDYGLEPELFSMSYFFEIWRVLPLELDILKINIKYK